MKVFVKILLVIFKDPDGAGTVSKTLLQLSPNSSSWAFYTVSLRRGSFRSPAEIEYPPSRDRQAPTVNYAFTAVDQVLRDGSWVRKRCHPGFFIETSLSLPLHFTSDHDLQAKTPDAASFSACTIWSLSFWSKTDGRKKRVLYRQFCVGRRIFILELNLSFTIFKRYSVLSNV